ncbi:PREDICTED: anther-specific protein LAT52 [Nelumbo nucifera]|uniref:Anther-specific protein LAT52 n=2 Tax=Nelumbo nucifera TaxID=4432 RepID=A0A1U8BBA2_NELNU|nr:PREDICTED: anther-specific protein LAT52 [Nelumbo nucifera]DAD24853.1 TPA_asm: hypothetical protein HUJ06_026317 [Nelumbo nucifera]
MAKCFQALPLLAAALCFLSLAGFVHCDEQFFVQGKVYCDTCRTQFETKLSEPISGAKVRLECRSRENDDVAYSVEGETDTTGIYKLPVEGSHEEDICEVKLLSSPRKDCSEPAPGLDHARVLLSSNNGISSASRFANSLGFMVLKPIEGCSDVLKELGLLPGMKI